MLLFSAAPAEPGEFSFSADFVVFVVDVEVDVVVVLLCCCSRQHRQSLVSFHSPATLLFLLLSYCVVVFVVWLLLF